MLEGAQCRCSRGASTQADAETQSCGNPVLLSDTCPAEAGRSRLPVCPWPGARVTEARGA